MLNYSMLHLKVLSNILHIKSIQQKAIQELLMVLEHPI